MTPTYTITESLNLIAGATALELIALVQIVQEESAGYNSHELAVIADQISARRQALTGGLDNPSQSQTFKKY